MKFDGKFAVIFSSYNRMLYPGDEERPSAEGRCPSCGYTCRCGCASN